jgi:hypothetical protein
MDQKDTEILFEHTRKLRRRHEKEVITIENRTRGRSRDPQLAWVRRRSKSAHREEKSPKRVSVKFDLFS